MVKAGEKYLHFKGDEYIVLSVGRSSKDLRGVVSYRADYDSEEFGKDAVWVRDYDDFVGYVEVKGKMFKRFVKIEDGVRIRVKKLKENAVLPKYARDGDAGMDVVAISKRVTDKFIEYGTGLAFEVPKNYTMLLFPRSSVTKKDLLLANSVGVLDSGYRGELMVRYQKLGEDDYEVGERVGQIMVLPYPKVEFEEASELEMSDRGEGGFGSTGK